ncbi:hypothetical protein BKA81DRAFT_357397 [Phyllosticta paracitricarpa]
MELETPKRVRSRSRAAGQRTRRLEIDRWSFFGVDVYFEKWATAKQNKTERWSKGGSARGEAPIASKTI